MPPGLAGRKKTDSSAGRLQLLRLALLFQETALLKHVIAAMLGSQAKAFCKFAHTYDSFTMTQSPITQETPSLTVTTKGFLLWREKASILSLRDDLLMPISTSQAGQTSSKKPIHDSQPATWTSTALATMVLGQSYLGPCHFGYVCI